jgi:Spy/CpxP family protein refolding chaperone
MASSVREAQAKKRKRELDPMKKNILQMVLAAAISASFLCAQTTSGATHTPPTPAQAAANMVARLTKLLDLTSAQQTTATGIFTTEVTSLASVTTGMKTQQSALQAAVLKNDSAAIAAAAEQIGSLTTQRVVAQAGADAAFYAILTADQQSKYTTLKPLGRGGAAGPFSGHRRG